MSAKERRRVIVCFPHEAYDTIVVYENDQQRKHAGITNASGARLVRLIERLRQDKWCYTTLFTFGWSLAVYGDINTTTDVR